MYTSASAQNHRKRHFQVERAGDEIHEIGGRSQSSRLLATEKHRSPLRQSVPQRQILADIRHLPLAWIFRQSETDELAQDVHWMSGATLRFHPHLCHPQSISDVPPSAGVASGKGDLGSLAPRLLGQPHSPIQCHQKQVGSRKSEVGSDKRVHAPTEIKDSVVFNSLAGSSLRVIVLPTSDERLPTSLDMHGSYAANNTTFTKCWGNLNRITPTLLTVRRRLI